MPGKKSKTAAKPELECPVCHKLFTPRIQHQKCCCEEHGKKYYAMRHRGGDFDRSPKECPWCHKMFTPIQPNQQFCTPRHRELWTYARQRESRGLQAKEPELECPRCHRMFQPKRTGQGFCSAACRQKFAYEQKKLALAAERAANPEAAMRECPYCHERYPTNRYFQVTCGKPECKEAHRRRLQGPSLRPGDFNLDYDPYATGRLRSDAMFCPVI